MSNERAILHKCTIFAQMILPKIDSQAREPRDSGSYRPCLSAFWFPFGAPEPLAPPCMRQRRFPLTAGDAHGVPRRVLAPQRRLAPIARVSRRRVGAMSISSISASLDRNLCFHAQVQRLAFLKRYRLRSQT